MTIALFGYSGFVGSNILQFYKIDEFYNSKNITSAINKDFDIVYFCGVPANKWYANKYSQEDLDIIESIQNILKTITCKKFILISTIDVYEDVNLCYNEDYDCDYVINHSYGRNRYRFEYFIKNHFNDYNIIRLPALFGKGLKKNIIYDLIYNNQIDKIPVNSSFQWYNLNWLKNDIEIIIKNNIKICNLFTEPLQTSEIIKIFDYDDKFMNHSSNIVYNTKTKYSHLFNSSIDGYIRDKDTVLNNIIIFLKFKHVDKSNLVVSNICVKNISQFQFSCILKLFEIKYVQIAPTTLIDEWKYLAKMNTDIFKNNEIDIYSFQSISYGLNNLNIFDKNTRDLLFVHFKNVIDYAISNNIKVIVFGCPKNRYILNYDSQSNDNIFCSFFKKIGDYIGDNNLTICIEPNSKLYSCNYINTIKQAGNIVRKINNKNIKLMLDIGNIIMENDNINDMIDYIDILYNVDISSKNMCPFIEITNSHKQFIQIIKSSNYKNKLNLEMILHNDNAELELELLVTSLNSFILL